MDNGCNIHKKKLIMFVTYIKKSIFYIEINNNKKNLFIILFNEIYLYKLIFVMHVHNNCNVHKL